MVPAFVIFAHWSDIIIIFLCAIVFVFLLKSIKLNDRLWLGSVVSVIIVALLSVDHIVSYGSLMEQLREKEAALESMKEDYQKLKTETKSARATFASAKEGVVMSRQEMDDLRARVNAEFERTIGEIRRVYANISDEELNRRFNNAVRKARQNLQNNVFQ